MLPTTGFFKDIDCPYYYDSTCGRPYCHFRHRKRNQDSSEDSQDGTENKLQVPTYNPTPKSQLQQARSHIPISYVPDIVVRTERSYRNPPTYSMSDKLTYKPTPLSELTKTIKTNASIVEDDIQTNEEEIPCKNVEPETNSNSDDINFEELSTEFDMIDDIINEESIAECSEVGNNNLLSNDDKQINKSKSENKSSKEVRSSSKNEHKSHKSKSSSSKSEKHNSRSDSKMDKSKDRKHRGDGSSSRRSSTTKDTEKNSSSKSSSSKTREENSKNCSKRNDLEKSKHKHRSREKTDDKQKSKDDKKNKDRNTKDSHRESKDKHKEFRNKDNNRSKYVSKHKEKSKPSKEKETKKCVSENEEKGHISNQDISDSQDVGADIFLDNFDDDDDAKYTSVEEECFRIFNEYKPEPINPPDPLQKEAAAEYIPTPKKRIAHQGAENNYVPKITHAPPNPSQNPALAMMNRFKAAKIAQASNEQNNIFGAVRSIKRSYSEDEDTKSSVNRSVKVPKIALPKEKTKKENVSLSVIDDIINGTTSQYVPTKVSNEFLMKAKVKKIAPVQNINLFQQAKAKAELAKRNAVATKTPIQSLGKGTKRVAHVPDMSMGDLPDVLQPDNKKIPVNVRTRYLTMIADECLKLYLLKHDAYERALNEELKVVERCAAVITYRNSAMLTVNRLRKELQERNAKGLGPISGDNAEDSDKNSQFKGRKFYVNILQYTLTDEDLDIHGYPREGPVPGKAVIKTQKQMPKVNLNPNQRLCCRCYKVYTVDDRGMPSYEEECIYHPLKKRTIRGDRIYLCCKSSEDTGCVTANTHVCETEAELEGYQTTMEPERDDDPRSFAVYALDCEMCYTTKGLELTRVTVVDSQCKTVYESLVKPLNPIIDYNTQFSGITKDQMDRTSTSILQVQANILHLCNSRTILIGHSLESDMKALKIIHSNIIDTAVLFPHRLGLPLKKALRVLASEFLKKIIQSNINGHDSAEDALTCMELVVWKLKEDLKTRGVKA